MATQIKARDLFGITILLSLLAVMIFTTPAWSECAWVLWWRASRTLHGPAGSTDESWHRLFAAVETAAACQFNARDKARYSHESLRDAVKRGRWTSVEYKPDSTMVFAQALEGGRVRESWIDDFQCWPDTVDPRK